MALWSFHKSVEGRKAVLTTSLARAKAGAAGEVRTTAESGLSNSSSNHTKDVVLLEELEE